MTCLKKREAKVVFCMINRLFAQWDLLQQLIAITCSDKLISLTHLTRVLVFFPFTQHSINCLIQVVTINRIIFVLTSLTQINEKVDYLMYE